MTVLFLKQSEGRSTPSAVGFIADPVRPVRIPLARRPAGCGRSAGRSPWVVAARNRLEHLRPHSPPISRLQLRPASVGEAYEPAEASATPATRSKRMMHGFGRFVRIPRRLRCLDDRGRKCGLLGQAIAAARRRAGAQFMRRRCNRCRPQWLRAPTITACSERSPVSGDLFAFVAAPSIAARFPFSSIWSGPGSASGR